MFIKIVKNEFLNKFNLYFSHALSRFSFSTLQTTYLKAKSLTNKICLIAPYQSLLLVTFIAFLNHCSGSNITSNEYLTSNYSISCREKNRLLGGEFHENFEFVTVKEGSDVSLQCHYCNETDDTQPKTWYTQSQFLNTTPAEIDFVTNEELSINHMIKGSDHSLTIHNVTRQDGNIYFCHGLEGQLAEDKFNYMLDVTRADIKLEIGTMEEWRKYLEEIIKPFNVLFSNSTQHEYKAIREEYGILMQVKSEWGSWSPCDGCTSKRTRIAKCHLKPKIMNVNLSIFQ